MSSSFFPLSALQVRDVKAAFPDFPIVTNGNTITYSDVLSNLSLTNCDGLMSAEGILDNPALFDPSYRGTKVDLAREYLALVDEHDEHPATIRTVVFHVRRMMRDSLNRFQLMDSALRSPSMEALKAVVSLVENYLADPSQFTYDAAAAAAAEGREKEERERREREEGKRRRYEERMVRKAKREGKDTQFYLVMGAEVPTAATVRALKQLERPQQLEIWNTAHKQHCLPHHLDEGGCGRDRNCAFLHVNVGGCGGCGGGEFVEGDEVAG